MKNKGGGRDGRVRFEKEYFARMPDAASFGVEKTAEQKQKEAEKKSEYNKTYYIQTPFRIWRAPYSGSVKVHHELRAKTGVKAYLARSGETGKREIENDAVFEAAEKAEFYFIHDADSAHTAVDKDTRGKDITWDVTITYETVKPFSVTHIPVFCPLRQLGKQSYRPLSAKDVLESDTYGYTAAFESIYTTHRSQVTEDGDTTYTTTLTLKDDWQEVCSKEIIEAVCKKLIEKK
ncbi:hypothetical protein, partial [Treponema socranskii]|uniref:hypothetical protein n=1 Tax=Treponema socranskii TaxID=53419 RepID=UPI003D8BE745